MKEVDRNAWNGDWCYDFCTYIFSLVGQPWVGDMGPNHQKVLVLECVFVSSRGLVMTFQPKVGWLGAYL